MATIRQLKVDHNFYHYWQGGVKDRNSTVTLEMEMPTEDVVTVYEHWQDMFPGKVIIKCDYCGQWGARKTSCLHCGAPID